MLLGVLCSELFSLGQVSVEDPLQIGSAGKNILVDSKVFDIVCAVGAQHIVADALFQEAVDPLGAHHRPQSLVMVTMLFALFVSNGPKYELVKEICYKKLYMDTFRFT